MNVSLTSDQIEQLEQFFVSMLEQGGVPGASMAVVVGDQVVYAKGFGARNLEKNLPATPQTMYGIGSCSKSFTAMAIMQLAEKGQINLEDPVNKYVPLKLGRPERPITIHHLLSMSSGIPDTGITSALLKRYCEHKQNAFHASSWDNLYLHINGNSQWIFEPEKYFFYSNESYALLSKIVEKVSKMRFPDYMKEKIFKPLKMKRTTYIKEEFEKESDIMIPYLEDLTPTIHPFDQFIYGCGGILSPVLDLSNYLIAYMNGGVFDGNAVLSEESLNKMLSYQFKCEMARSQLGDIGNEGYGYGWVVIDNYLGYKWIGHGGQISGSSASLIFVPEKKIGVAIACNSGGGQGLMIAIPFILITAMLGKDPMKSISVFGIEQKLNMLTGVYKSYKNIHQMLVIKQESMLCLQSEAIFNNKPKMLIPETDKIENFRFYMISAPGAKESVEFIVNSEGKIDLIYDRYHFKKVRDL